MYYYGGLSKKQLFEEISQLSDFCDIQLVERVYYALVRVISRQLRAGKIICLPDWGRFSVYNYPPKQMMDVKTRRIRNTQMKKIVKFTPDWKVKDYFKNL